MEELIKIIGDIGFPIAVSAYLLIRMENKIDQLATCIKDLSTVIENKVNA